MAFSPAARSAHPSHLLRRRLSGARVLLRLGEHTALARRVVARRCRCAARRALCFGRSRLARRERRLAARDLLLRRLQQARLQLELGTCAHLGHLHLARQLVPVGRGVEWPAVGGGMLHLQQGNARALALAL
jgi:hypothetical protein